MYFDAIHFPALHIHRLPLHPTTLPQYNKI